MYKKLGSFLLSLLVSTGLLGQVPVSNLPQATLPLTGNESVVMNQSGTTKQGKVSSITSLVNLSAATGITLTPNPIVGSSGTIGLTIPVVVSSGGTGAISLSGLVLGNGSGPFTNYAGAACTNQFLRSLSGSGAGTCNSVANTDLVNSSFTLNGSSISLGGTRTLSLASSDFVNQGTTTTLLHGNAAGNPSFAAVNLATEVTGNLSVNNLNSGTGASSTTFWAGNGVWATPVAAMANPSGLIGLTAVNGVATTATRSDATHALDQSISPTMTGAWTFSTTLTSPPVLFTSNFAGGQLLNFTNTSNSVTNRCWTERIGSTGTFTLDTCTDGGTDNTANLALAIARTGAAITALSFGNTTDNPTFSFLGTGGVTATGQYTVKQATTASYGIFQAGDTTGSRILQILSVGSTATPVYGIPAGSAGIDTTGSASLTLSTADTARVVISSSGNLTINAPSSGAAETVTGAASSATAFVLNANTGAGASNGMVIRAGTNSSDAGFKVSNAGNTLDLFTVNGDGGVLVGAPTGGDKGLGTVNAQALYLQGQPVDPVVVLASCTAGGCTALRASGASTTITRTSAGLYGVTFSSTFALQPACTVTPTSTSGSGITTSLGTTSTTVQTFIISAGSAVATDMSWSMICF